MTGRKLTANRGLQTLVGIKVAEFGLENEIELFPGAHRRIRRRLLKWLFLPTKHAAEGDTRKLNDGERVVEAVKRTEGKRLTYDQYVCRN